VADTRSVSGSCFVNRDLYAQPKSTSVYHDSSEDLCNLFAALCVQQNISLVGSYMKSFEDALGLQFRRAFIINWAILRADFRVCIFFVLSISFIVKISFVTDISFTFVNIRGR
jgi:hypothetical protein